MNLTPWFQIGKDGVPHRSGRYLFEIWIKGEAPIHMLAEYQVGNWFVVTDDARIIGLTYEDYWRGVLK